MHSKIKIYGEKVLRMKGEEVKDGGKVKELVLEMEEILREIKGFGLAAHQIGKPLNLFIVNFDLIEKGKGIKEFINPKLLYYEDEEIMEEGCLSIPELFVEIRRPKKIVMEYYDLDMKKNIINADGLTARVLLHEYDHINGILIFDRLPEEEKKIAVAKWKKLWKEKEKRSSR